jgi:uncharacterized protein involved in outer membrane biogenesis
MKQIPTYISGLVNDYFAKKMPNARFEMGDVAMSALSPGKFSFGAIKFVSSKKGIPELEVEIERLSVDLDVLPLLKGDVRIGALIIEKPKVIFRDGDAKPKEEKESSHKNRSLNFDLRGASISDGEFTYVRMTHGTVATLNVHNIQAESGPLGRTLGNQVELKARGRIEKSGTVDLKIGMPLFETPLKVYVAIDVDDQNLADLTPFFKENAGVELHGKMLEGRGTAKLEGRSLSAEVWAKYKDFDLKLHKMYDRSEAAAFFMNLGTAIATAEKNTGKPAKDQQRGVNIQREAGEPVVGFILRGLKEAALRVSMAK